MTMRVSGLAATRLLASLALRRARRGKLAWLTTGVVALPALAALLILLSGGGGSMSFMRLLDVFLRYLVPFVMALHASATVAEEVQAKTITYLYSRPVPRWALPLGKLAGNVALNASLLAAGLILVYLLCLLGDPAQILTALPRLGRGLAALLLGAMLFGTVAAAFGAMATSAPFVGTMIYLLVVEIGFSFVPGWFKVTAMTVHLRAIAGTYEPQGSMFLADPTLSPVVSLLVVLLATAVWLAIALAWVEGTEYRTDQ